MPRRRDGRRPAGTRRVRAESLGEAYRRVLSQTWFAALSTSLAAAATALFAWQLATSNGVTFVAQQDVELIQSDTARRRAFARCPKGRRAAANRAAGGDAVHHLSGSERTRG